MGVKPFNRPAECQDFEMGAGGDPNDFQALDGSWDVVIPPHGRMNRFVRHDRTSCLLAGLVPNSLWPLMRVDNPLSLIPYPLPFASCIYAVGSHYRGRQ